jgi:hypothetical protein
MSNPKYLDALIGQALECIDEAAREIRELPLEPTNVHVRKIGNAVLELWELRDALYKVHPEIKRDLVVESEMDEARFEALSSLHAEALAAESAGRVREAAATFERLQTDASFGFFKLCAEAGLYRTRNASKA